MKQEIFERVVEWDRKKVVDSVFIFLFLVVGFVAGIGVSSEMPLSIPILAFGLVVFIFSIIFDRKVYWRKKE